MCRANLAATGQTIANSTADQDGALARITSWSVAAIAVIATALAVLYPSFGVTLIVVLVAEGILSAVRGRGSAVGADSGG